MQRSRGWGSAVSMREGSGDWSLAPGKSGGTGRSDHGCTLYAGGEKSGLHLGAAENL